MGALSQCFETLHLSDSTKWRTHVIIIQNCCIRVIQKQIVSNAKEINHSKLLISVCFHFAVWLLFNHITVTAETDYKKKQRKKRTELLNFSLKTKYVL